MFSVKALTKLLLSLLVNVLSVTFVLHLAETEESYDAHSVAGKNKLIIFKS